MSDSDEELNVIKLPFYLGEFSTNSLSEFLSDLFFSSSGTLLVGICFLVFSFPFFPLHCQLFAKKKKSYVRSLKLPPFVFIVFGIIVNRNTANTIDTVALPW